MTLQDLDTQAARPVMELAQGRRVDLREFLGCATMTIAQAMDEALPHLDAIRRALETDGDAGFENTSVLDTATRGERLLPPVPNPRTFRDFYVFERHVAACRARRGLEMVGDWYRQPVFYFSNPMSLVGHDRPVYAPLGSEQLDFELELGVIIGKPGRNIPRQEAWNHVAGFTIINDFSARDLQRQEMAVGLGPAKGKDFATAVGPHLVTLDEVADRIDEEGRIHLRMTARVNGRELSAGNSAEMHFTWPTIIEHASHDAELFPGDLLGSGTVGTGCILELGPENTGGWLKPGDVVELEIERLGVLRTPIVERPESSEGRRVIFAERGLVARATGGQPCLST